MMAPVSAGTDRVVPVRNSAQAIPASAAGSAESFASARVPWHVNAKYRCHRTSNLEMSPWHKDGV
jgi:hypothetical protein